MAAEQKTACVEIHKAADLGNVGMKAIVQKLNGDPKSKFEVDHKMNVEQFHKLVLKLSVAPPEEDQEPSDEVNPDLFAQYTGAFRKALCEAGEPFKGDLENETYKAICAAFRAFDPNAPTE